MESAAVLRGGRGLYDAWSLCFCKGWEEKHCEQSVGEEVDLVEHLQAILGEGELLGLGHAGVVDEEIKLSPGLYVPDAPRPRRLPTKPCCTPTIPCACRDGQLPPPQLDTRRRRLQGAVHERAGLDGMLERDLRPRRRTGGRSLCQPRCLRR